jgi:hypothetical protein
MMKTTCLIGHLVANRDAMVAGGGFVWGPGPVTGLEVHAEAASIASAARAEARNEGARSRLITMGTGEV